MEGISDLLTDFLRSQSWETSGKNKIDPNIEGFTKLNTHGLAFSTKTQHWELTFTLNPFAKIRVSGKGQNALMLTIERLEAK